MRNKIKYESFRHPFDSPITIGGNSRNPTKYENLPDGDYYIRGEVKGSTKRYVVIQGRWYFTKDSQYIIKYRDYFMAKFLLFPNLPEKEYEILFKMYNRLSKEWKLNCDAKRVWLKSRVNKRSFTKWLREIKSSTFHSNQIE